MERASNTAQISWALIIATAVFFLWQVVNALESIPLEKVDARGPAQAQGLSYNFDPNMGEPCMAKLSFICEDPTLEGELPCEALDGDDLTQLCKKLKKSRTKGAKK